MSPDERRYERMAKITTFDAKPPAGGKKRVAAYCRVSTDTEEQMVSLLAQKGHYEKYIRENKDWIYAGIYCDEGITGTNKENRPALRRMMRACREGKIDYIITKSLSRFARNTTDCLMMVRKLLRLGIGIYFEKENIDTTTMDSELLLAIMSQLAEDESRSISQNTKWSIHQRFNKGTYIVSTPPYGYENKDGKMVINEEEAKVIRYIFSEMLSGRGSYQIAKSLERKGIPTKRRGNWNTTIIREMLSNEKYVGDMLCQKTYVDDHFKDHRNKGEKEMYLVTDHHEPIIDRADFEAAQNLLKVRSDAACSGGTSKFQNRYPFSGKIYCAECGDRFKRRINNATVDKTVFWVCRTHTYYKERCSMDTVKNEALELAFTLMMNKLIYASEEMLKPFFIELTEKNRTIDCMDVEKVDEKLEKNRESMRKLLEVMTKGCLDAAVYSRENLALAREADELAKAKERLASSKGEIFSFEMEIKALYDFARHSDYLKEFDGDLFTRFVDRIIVYSKHEIAFKLKCGLTIAEGV